MYEFELSRGFCAPLTPLGIDRGKSCRLTLLEFQVVVLRMRLAFTFVKRHAGLELIAAKLGLSTAVPCSRYQSGEYGEKGRLVSRRSEVLVPLFTTIPVIYIRLQPIHPFITRCAFSASYRWNFEECLARTTCNLRACILNKKSWRELA